MVTIPKKTLGLFASGISILGLSSGCDKHTGSYSMIGTSQSFSQSPAVYQQSKVDVLWVVDNSPSMQTSQANLAQNFKSFITQFEALGLDYHMAVTGTDAYLADPFFNNSLSNYNANNAKFLDGSTGTYGQGHSGQFVMTPANTTPAIFSQNVSIGTSGSGDERAFSSIISALNDSTNVASGFRRSDAYLAIIIVSDEDDFSGQATFADHFYQSLAQNWQGDHNYNAPAPFLQPVSYYVSALDTYVGSHNRYSVHSIFADSAACVATLNQSAPNTARIVAQRYPAISAATSGVTASLCSDFSGVLSGMSQKVIELASVFTLARAANISTINVTVNGQVVPQDATNGWVYLVNGQPATSNPVTTPGQTYTYAVAFKGTAVPPAGASISINFTPATISNN
jgi:hypothetical protein